MPSSLVLTRRAALLGAVALGAAACDTDDLRPPSDTSATTAAATASGRPGADETLVAEAAAAIRSALASVQAARGTTALRQPLAPLLRDHRRHLAVLGAGPDSGAGRASGQGTARPTVGGSASTSASSTAPVGADATRAAVVQQEQALQAELIAFAVRAESGVLAALLASMSASVAQHLAVLGVGG